MVQKLALDRFRKVCYNVYMITMIFDGGYSTVNGGYGSFIIFEGNKQLAFRHRIPFPGVMTGNQAEYAALWHALLSLKDVAPTGSGLTIYGDSKLVISQIMGQWRVKDVALRRYRDLCLEALGGYDWTARWWPREQSLQFFNH